MSDELAVQQVLARYVRAHDRRDGDAKPASGWPAGASGAMGTITPIESGYYTQRLVRVDGQWLIESLQIRHNLPFAF